MEFVPARSEDACLGLLGVSMVLLTVGIGYFVVFRTTLADFLVIVAGLFVGWTAFFYCFAHFSGWRE